MAGEYGSFASKTGVAVRVAAARCVAAAERQQQSLSESLPAAEQRIAERDRPLLRELTYGTVRNQPKLALWRKQLLNSNLKSRDADVAALLLCGLYQLSEMRIPPHAAISATVEASRSLGKPWAAKLLNGCLRNFQRREEELKALAVTRPIARFNHPEWWLTELRQAWPSNWQAVAEANNEQAPMTLRVNQRQSSRDDYLKQLEAAGIPANAGQLAPQAITLTNPVEVGALPGFAEGAVSVQDEAPQLAAELLGVEAGMRVLDACAAPGGKTANILERADCDVLALDVSAKRLERVTETLQRLQLQAEVRCADIRQLGEWYDGRPFDRILLDAPCSASGVIRRHPDIKLLRRQDDLAELAELQWQCLEALWPTLAVGGQLLYATCSVLPIENFEVIKRARRLLGDAELLPITLQGAIGQASGCQLLPGNAGVGTDGFFYALLEKTG